MAKPVFRTDDEWSALDGEPCRVKSFTANATVENGRVSGAPRGQPYASITFESRQLPEDALGFVTHKIDFLHLWRAFNERGVRDDEEVIFFWVKSHLKSVARHLGATMPKLLVWICPREAFELMTDSNFKPELDGMARFNAERPRAKWTPEIMESYDPEDEDEQNR
jgi:hypothetical protein